VCVLRDNSGTVLGSVYGVDKLKVGHCVYLILNYFYNSYRFDQLHATVAKFLTSS